LANSSGKKTSRRAPAVSARRRRSNSVPRSGDAAELQTDPAASDNDPAAPPPLRRWRRQFQWEHAEVEPYKVGSHRGAEFAGASRQVLIGKRGERVGFHLRYFELQAGGYTSLEQHRHSHVVVGVRGRGVVRVGEKTYTMAPLDAIYIGPEQVHQLRAAGRNKFGFFCIVDAQRDQPRPVQPEAPISTGARAQDEISIALNRHPRHG
jgi:ribulose-bisphosphate carboxylase large chain